MNKEKQCYFCGEEVSLQGHIEIHGNNIIDVCDTCNKNKGE